MSNDTKNGTPEAVRNIVGAVVRQALSRCDSLGISWDAFYQALLEEQKLHPEVGVAEIIDLTFRRLQGNAN